MKIIKLVDVPFMHGALAVRLAEQFLKDKPDNIGIYNGAAYFRGENDPSFYVYQTKTTVVVRGTKKEG